MSKYADESGPARQLSYRKNGSPIFQIGLQRVGSFNSHLFAEPADRRLIGADRVYNHGKCLRDPEPILKSELTDGLLASEILE